MKNLRIAKAAIEFDLSSVSAITERDEQSAGQYAGYRKEYDKPGDDSDRLLQPWRDALVNWKNPVVIDVFPAPDAIELAKEKVRLHLAEHPGDGITVFLHNGIYPFHETVHFTKADSGKIATPVLWLGESRDGVRFSGSETVSGFRPVSDQEILKRLHPAARKKVLCKKLNQIPLPPLPKRGMGYGEYPVAPWFDCFSEGKRLTLARWPKKRDPQCKIESVLSGSLNSLKTEAQKRGPESRAIFHFSHENMKRWTFAEDIRADGQWGYLWASESRKVEQIDTEAGTVTLDPVTRYGCLPGDPFYFFNLLEELSDPGEWYLDRSHGILYCIPERDVRFHSDGTADYKLEISLLKTPFLEFHETENVIFRNLSMLRGAADAVMIENGKQILFAEVDISGMGGNAMIVKGGSDCGIFQAHLYELGAGGVKLAGGDRKKLKRANHFAINVHIHNYSQVDRSYTPAATLSGCGNYILHMHLHHTSHHGISVSGDLQTVGWCDGHDLVQDFDDQAGIDCFFDPFMYGTRYLFNFWHDLGSGIDFCGQAGIRLDDMISNILLYGNIFLHCAGGGFGGIQIHGGKNNIVENNLFIDCARALSFSCRDEEFWQEALAKPFYTTACENGLSEEKLKIAPRLQRVREDQARNFIVNNLILNCGETAGFNQYQRDYQYLGNNLCIKGDLKEMGFFDPEHQDFRMKSDSILLKQLPFAKIPFERIGIDEKLSL